MTTAREVSPYDRPPGFMPVALALALTGPLFGILLLHFWR